MNDDSAMIAAIATLGARVVELEAEIEAQRGWIEGLEAGRRDRERLLTEERRSKEIAEADTKRLRQQLRDVDVAATKIVLEEIQAAVEASTRLSAPATLTKVEEIVARALGRTP